MPYIEISWSKKLYIYIHKITCVSVSIPSEKNSGVGRGSNFREENGVHIGLNTGYII